MKKIFCLVAAAMLLGGCARNDGPAVSLVNVHFEAATVLETTAVFTLRLENDKPEPLHLNGSVHKIYLNGLSVGSGLSDATMDVPRLSTVTNDVTVHLSNLALVTRVKSVIESKKFDYRIVSRFYGQSWFSGTRSVAEGKLELTDFMPTPTNEVPAEAPAPASEAK
jgi:LEA14-like dessication related protein